jgi:hypothetical protein
MKKGRSCQGILKGKIEDFSPMIPHKIVQWLLSGRKQKICRV